MFILNGKNQYKKKFYGIIKDKQYLNDLVDQCEREYNINIFDYINDYSDMNRLLKYLEE